MNFASACYNVFLLFLLLLTSVSFQQENVPDGLEASMLTGTSLGLAIQRGDLVLADYILRQRPHLSSTLFANDFDDDDPSLQGGQTTPLHCAIKHENLQMASLLIEHGALVNVANGAGATSLGWAVRQNASVDMLTLLLDNGGDYLIEYRDFTGRTPLQMAVANGNLATVQILLRRLAQPDGADEDNCARPLLLAVQLKSSVPTCANLTNDEAFVECQHRNGEIFLAIAEELIRFGANPRLTDPCTTLSPLDMARGLNDRQILHLFGDEGYKWKFSLKKSNGTSASSLNKTLLREFELFDLFSETRCNGNSRGTPFAHLGNVRMISVDECANVCEELPQCIGFNLMLTPSSGARGNGCIIKAGPCQLVTDPMFAFYRKKPMASAPPSFTISLGSPVAAEGMPIGTAKRALEITSPRPLSAVQHDYLPPGSGPAFARSPHHTVDNNRIYPNSAPNNFYNQMSYNYHRQNQQQQQPYKDDDVTKKELNLTNCDNKLPWYGWLMIGVFSGLLSASFLFAFALHQWKQNFLRRSSHDGSGSASPTSVSYLQRGTSSKTTCAENNGAENQNIVNGNNNGQIFTIEPVGVFTKPPISFRRQPVELNFASTTCWSSSFLAEIISSDEDEDGHDYDNLRSRIDQNQTKKRRPTTVPLCSLEHQAGAGIQTGGSGDDVINGRPTPEEQTKDNNNNSSTSPLSGASSNRGQIISRKKTPTTGSKQEPPGTRKPKSATLTGTKKKAPKSAPVASARSETSSLPSPRSNLPPVTGLPPIHPSQRSRHTLKGIHKVDVVDWQNSPAPLVVNPAPSAFLGTFPLVPAKQSSGGDTIIKIPTALEPDEAKKDEQANNNENGEQQQDEEKDNESSKSKKPPFVPPILLFNNNIKGARSTENLAGKCGSGDGDSTERVSALSRQLFGASQKPGGPRRQCWIDYRELFASAAMKLGRHHRSPSANSGNENGDINKKS